MADKHPTQAVPDDGRKGEPDGTGVPADERGAGGGGPRGPKPDGKPFRGGQSKPAYHGPGQLGERTVDGDDANRNATRRED